MSYQKFATVLLEEGLERPLSYGVPDELLGSAQVGASVRVPLQKRECKGTITALHNRCSYRNVRPLLEVIVAPLPPDLSKLTHWIASYYSCPLSKVMKTAIPSAVRGQSGPKEQLVVERAGSRDQLIEMAKRLRSRAPAQAAVLDAILPHKGTMLLTELLEKSGSSRSSVRALSDRGAIHLRSAHIERSPIADQEYFRSLPKKLSCEQGEALDKISRSLSSGQFETHLLFGVTGSGKTEVYLQAIDHALSLEKQSLVLVPEISLTGQTLERFRSRFEGKIALLHHRLSSGERYDEWHRIRSGEAKIVIGARSAIFCPLPNLGLIVVDEEHEQSYKQSDTAPCYHARDVAVMRGKLCEATVVLGSATPSLESYRNCEVGKYTLSTLTGRHESARLPSVEIVDMGRAMERAGGYTLFSDELLNALKKRYELGEQSLLLLNRRGYHTSQFCPKCGTTVECPHCDIPLTFHRSKGHLTCHLCSYTVSPPPNHCPSCGHDQPMRFRGAGTEQVERALHAALPELRTLRVDSDTTRHKGSCERLLRQFRSGKADVLVGTQMIAKGLHFPSVTLVGVLQADAGLQIPDYRASEQLFQLVTQVAGRAGRGALAGEVILQAYNPGHEALRFAKEHNYLAFYQSEVRSREQFGYPPFAHLVKVTISSEDEGEALSFAEQLQSSCGSLPVVPSGQPKVKGRYRFQLLLKGPAASPLVDRLQKAIRSAQKPNGVHIAIDVDPTSLI